MWQVESSSRPIMISGQSNGNGAIISALILSLDGVDFGDALAVAIFSDLGGKPGGNDLAHLSARDRLASQREDVRVVVLARIARHRHRVTRRSPNTRNFIRRHRTTNTGAVDDYTEVRTAVRDRPSDGMREVRIVNCVFRVGSEVLHSVSELG